MPPLKILAGLINLINVGTRLNQRCFNNRLYDGTYLHPGYGVGAFRFFPIVTTGGLTIIKADQVISFYTAPPTPTALLLKRRTTTTQCSAKQLVFFMCLPHPSICYRLLITLTFECCGLRNANGLYIK